MMRSGRFTGAILFAAGAAACSLPWMLCLAPLVGGGAAQTSYLVLVTALYVASLHSGAVAPARLDATARPALSRLTLALLAGLAGTAVAALTRSPAELAFGLAAVLGVARSGFLYRAAPARALVVEVILLTGGLCFARFLAGSAWPPAALGLWGFLLVQSLFFLVPAVRPRHPAPAYLDPFEDAHRHAVALLERID